MASQLSTANSQNGDFEVVDVRRNRPTTLPSMPSPEGQMAASPATTPYAYLEELRHENSRLSATIDDLATQLRTAELDIESYKALRSSTEAPADFLVLSRHADFVVDVERCLFQSLTNMRRQCALFERAHRGVAELRRLLAIVGDANDDEKSQVDFKVLFDDFNQAVEALRAKDEEIDSLRRTVSELQDARATETARLTEARLNQVKEQLKSVTEQKQQLDRIEDMLGELKSSAETPKKCKGLRRFFSIRRSRNIDQENQTRR